MSDITVEQKMAALREIRSTYSKNQYDLSKRERILYGKTSAREYMDNSYQSVAANSYSKTTYIPFEEKNISAEKTNSFLLLRFLLAIAIMISIIMIDQKSQNIAGYTSRNIFQAISYDYTDAIEGWIKN